MADRSRFSPFDEYDLKARAVPALFALAPLTALIIIWWPALWTLAGILASAGLALVLLVCLAYLVASLGEGLEKKWGEAIGTPHSARLLSHRDDRIYETDKAELHAFFASHNQSIPSEADEKSADAKAQQIRIARVKWLITVSRPEAARSLLLNENIAYGFWRNLRALKWAALALAFVVVAVNAYLLYRAGQADPRLPAGIGLAMLCAVIVLFLLLAVTRAKVIEASLGYALRLFSLQNDAAVIALAVSTVRSPPPVAGGATP